MSDNRMSDKDRTPSSYRVLSPCRLLFSIQVLEQIDPAVRALGSDLCNQTSFFRWLDPELAQGQLVSLLLQTGNVSSRGGSGPSS